MTREQFAIGCVILVAVAVVCFIIGLLYGRGQGKDERAALEADLDEAEATAEKLRIRLHRAAREEPMWEHRAAREEPMWEYRADHPELAGQVVHVPVVEPTSVIPPDESDTAWTRRMGLELEAWTAAKLAETDEWLREMTR